MTPHPMSIQPNCSFLSHGSVASLLPIGRITQVRVRNPPMKAPVNGENCPTRRAMVLPPMWNNTMISIATPIQATDLTTKRDDEFISLLLHLCCLREHNDIWDQLRGRPPGSPLPWTGRGERLF